MHYDKSFKYWGKHLSSAKKFFDESIATGAKLCQILPTFFILLMKGAFQFQSAEESFGILSAVLYELARRTHEELGGGEISMTKLLISPTVSQSMGSLKKVHRDMSRSDTEFAVGEVNRTFRYAVHAYAYELNGRRRYQVADGLSEKLGATELRGLISDDIHLPYPCILLEAPRCPEFKVWNDETGWHPFESVNLLADSHHFDEALTGREFKREEEADILKEGRCIHAFFSGASMDPNDPLNDATIHTCLHMTPGMKMEDVIRDAEATHRGKLGAYWEELLNWILNVLVYATWPDAERDHIYVDPEFKKLWDRAQKFPKKSKKKKRLLERSRQLDSNRIFVLGKSVLLDRRRGTESNDSGEKVARKMEIRVRVAGHWRRQAHGAGRKERKLIWIEPFWRGPKDAPIKLAPHVLRSEA